MDFWRFDGLILIWKINGSMMNVGCVSKCFCDFICLCDEWWGLEEVWLEIGLKRRNPKNWNFCIGMCTRSTCLHWGRPATLKRGGEQGSIKFFENFSVQSTRSTRPCTRSTGYTGRTDRTGSCHLSCPGWLDKLKAVETEKWPAICLMQGPVYQVDRLATRSTGHWNFRSSSQISVSLLCVASRPDLSQVDLPHWS